MPRYKLITQYDGTDFAGWQIQQDQPTVQGELQRALSTFLREDISVTGSGRTDAGVHAWGQSAHFDCNSDIDAYRFLHAVNALLPKSVSVCSVESAYDDFHARYQAWRRTYHYFITHSKTPFFDRFSHYDYHRFDIDILNRLSAPLIGEHDFTSFARSSTETENMICSMYHVRWSRRNEMTICSVSANRFLHGMVRAIVGTTIELYRREASPDAMRRILEARDRTEAGQSAPAKGLFLYRVEYPDHREKNE